MRKASLREYENGAGKENVKLSSPAFNRANLEFGNSKNEERRSFFASVTMLLVYWILRIFIKRAAFYQESISISITKREKVREQSQTYGFYFCFLSNILIIWKKISKQTTQVTIKVLKNQYILYLFGHNDTCKLIHKVKSINIRFSWFL